MTVEVLSGLQRKATFSISKDAIKQLTQQELKKYAKTAKAQGFRPGKVPATIVEQMYGGKAYEDALNDEISKKFSAIVDENKLNLAGYPKIDLTTDEGEDFVFAALFEVMPEVVIGDITTQEVVKPTCELTDADIEKTIQVLREQRANYVETQKAAANGDKVTIDFIGTVDGVAFDGGKAEDYPFILGKNQMLPEFEAGILGLQIGETKEVEVNFPENYHAENLKGKKAIFNITLKKVAAQQLPELSEEFINSVGVNAGTIEALKEEIRTNLNHEIKHRLHARLRENALNALNAVSPLEVPSNMVHDEIHHMMDRTKENMQKQGYKTDQIKLTHEMFEHDAKRFVTLRFLVQKFVEDNKMTVNDDEVKAVVTDMASLYEDPAEYISWYYTDQARVENAKAITMENKVIDKIASLAKIKEVAISYEELMQQR
jgi:trigger factor